MIVPVVCALVLTAAPRVLVKEAAGSAAVPERPDWVELVSQQLSRQDLHAVTDSDLQAIRALAEQRRALQKAACEKGPCTIDNAGADFVPEFIVLISYIEIGGVGMVNATASLVTSAKIVETAKARGKPTELPDRLAALSAQLAKAIKKSLPKPDAGR